MLRVSFLSERREKALLTTCTDPVRIECSLNYIHEAFVADSTRGRICPNGIQPLYAEHTFSAFVTKV